MRLLTLPAPYCTVALDCAIKLKTETAVPGRSRRPLRLPHCNSSSTQGLALSVGFWGAQRPQHLLWKVGHGVRDSGWLAEVAHFAGTLYQRLVIAEQNLKNELYPYQER